MTKQPADEQDIPPTAPFTAGQRWTFGGSVVVSSGVVIALIISIIVHTMNGWH